MLKNYITIAIRNITRNKIYSLVNIAGLTIGLTACFLILLYVQDELSYDRFHASAERVVRVVHEVTATKSGAAITSALLAPALEQEFPEIETSVRLHRYYNTILSVDDARYDENHFIFADPDFFLMFSFPLIKGNPETVLRDPFTLVITESKARKYFGDEDPVGQILMFNNEHDFVITGMMKDTPQNSHLKIDFLASFESLRSDRQAPGLEMWAYRNYYTYLLLRDGVSPAALEEKLPAFAESHVPGMDITRSTFTLQPITDIHLRSSHIGWDIASHSDISYIYSFSAIALFIILIACINFMNLSTARSSIRAKEIGLRKVIGANRLNLVKQFIGETILLSIIALMISVVLVELLLPTFNEISGKNMHIHYFSNLQFLSGVLLITILSGVLAGSYPALFLSSFQPVAIMKGTHTGGWKSGVFRKALVIAQFGISIALIIGAVFVYQQLEYVRHKNLGFDKEHVLVVNNQVDQRAMERYERFKNEIVHYPGVVHVSGSSSVPPSLLGNNIRVHREGSSWEETATLKLITTDYDFFETLDIEVISGRIFSREYGADATESFVISEAAARTLGLDEPIGIRLITQYDWLEGTIIGVVNDVHFQSLHSGTEPLIFSMRPHWYYRIPVRIRPENIAGTMGFLESSWNEVAPEWPFQYSFVDQDYENLYRAELRLSKVIWYFTGLAIFIACLGLFALASFTIERRTKEIGVRKVLGAPVGSIVYQLSRDFTKLVVAANIIAWPVAYYFVERWLQNFAYRIDVGPVIFLMAAGVSLLIAFLTVSYQSIKAAMVNPVESLRYE
jgi:putative ABC transport system permease protein